MRRQDLEEELRAAYWAGARDGASVNQASNEDAFQCFLEKLGRSRELRETSHDSGKTTNDMSAIMTGPQRERLSEISRYLRHERTETAVVRINAISNLNK